MLTTRLSIRQTIAPRVAVIACVVFAGHAMAKEYEQFGQYGAQYGAKVHDRAPPRCVADGYCTPRRDTWGYYPGRWRRWPYDVAAADAGQLRPIPSDLQPYEAPPAEQEDKRTSQPTPVRPTPMNVQPGPAPSGPAAEQPAAPAAAAPGANRPAPALPAPAEPFEVPFDNPLDNPIDDAPATLPGAEPPEDFPVFEDSSMRARPVAPIQAEVRPNPFDVPPAAGETTASAASMASHEEPVDQADDASQAEAVEAVVQKQDPPPLLPKELWTLRQANAKRFARRPAILAESAAAPPKIERLPDAPRIRDDGIRQAASVAEVARAYGGVETAESVEPVDAEFVVPAVHFAPAE